MWWVVKEMGFLIKDTALSLHNTHCGCVGSSITSNCYKSTEHTLLVYIVLSCVCVFFYFLLKWELFQWCARKDKRDERQLISPSRRSYL